MDGVIPTPQKWNKTEWVLARKRAIASKDPVCAICHKYILWCRNQSRCSNVTYMTGYLVSQT